jgi:hypothetical protein
MHRTAVLLVAAGLGVLGVSALASSAQTGPALIRITSTQTRYTHVDAGPGSTEIIRQKLYNRRITKTPIGRAEIVCTFTFGRARTCRATYFLAKGKIVVGGSISNRDIYELAILGGTGLYNNARGTFTAIRTAKGPRREFLIFRLAG